MAAAKAELDGLRKPSRPFNPLTIIQIKNAERNLDSRRESQWWSVWHLVQYYSRLRLCVTASLCVGLVLVGFMVWRLPYDCQDELCGRSTHPSALPNRLKRNAHWSKTYEDIGKFSGISLLNLKSQDGCGAACIFDLQYQQFRFPNELVSCLD